MQERGRKEVRGRSEMNRETQYRTQGWDGKKRKKKR
jgi:hypothetical protein